MARYPRFQGSVDKMSNNPNKYFLNNHLQNARKPISVGNYVHLTTMQGCFCVYGVDAMFFVIKKNQEFIRIPWEHLRMKKGVRGSSERAQTRETLENSIMKLKGMLQELRRY